MISTPPYCDCVHSHMCICIFAILSHLITHQIVMQQSGSEHIHPPWISIIKHLIYCQYQVLPATSLLCNFKSMRWCILDLSLCSDGAVMHLMLYSVLNNFKKTDFGEDLHTEIDIKCAPNGLSIFNCSIHSQ